MKRSKSSSVKSVLIAGLLSVSVAAGLSVTEARAYCVYNNTKQYLSEVHGEFCGACLSHSMLEPNGKVCCPGGKSGCRGNTWITVRVPNEGWQTGEHYKHCAREVTAHGWVKIYGTGAQLRCEVFDDNGTQLTGSPMIDGKKD